MLKNFDRYKTQFDNSKLLNGSKVISIQFYLESTDKDFTEQPNTYGKSLLNGIDIETDLGTFSIGNRFIDTHFGLSIDRGKTSDLEILYCDNDQKTPKNYLTGVVGKSIESVEIYWLPVSFPGENGLYPQEIEIMTDKGYLLISSIEITYGKVDNEFNDELLIIDNLSKAKELGLGQFGKRKVFQTLKDLLEA